MTQRTRGHWLYPADDPREHTRDAPLAMIRAQDPDWTPPGSHSQGWMLVVHDATEDQARARTASVAGARGFVRVG